MLTGTKLPVQQEGYCKLGGDTRKLVSVKLVLFSLGCRGGGKSLLKVTAAVGSRCERDALCILVQLRTGVCNWVEKGRLDLPSKRKPLRRLRALTCHSHVCVEM